jgi:O-antigen/teichoic acid export membrane protein
MRPAAADARAPSSASGEHEHHLAVSALAQQLSQAVSLLAMFAAITVLARRLSLSEFGTYGLLVSLAAYVIFIQTSISTAAIKAFAEAAEGMARDAAFATAVRIYTIAGLLAAVGLCGIGTLLVNALHIPTQLHHQARLAVAGLSALTAATWPLKTFHDLLGGAQRFALAAAAEATAFVVMAAILIVLTLAGAPLWALVTVGGSTPFLTGMAAMVFAEVRGVRQRYRRRSATGAGTRQFLRFSGYLIVIGLADVVISSIDRAILAGFRTTSTVGLYEGPARAHNLVRQVNARLGETVLPASARYLAEDDVVRTRDLLVRGMRYTVAVVVPLTVVLCVLAQPILRVWLGRQFEPASTALVLLVGYWLINANTGTPSAMLLAAGRIRAVTIYAGCIAVLNLGLSLALTPSLGLTGVVLGTTIAYVLGFPFFLRLALSTFQLSVRDITRQVWIPAYTTGALLAAALIVVRVTVPLTTALPLIATAVLALGSYWVAYYLWWLNASERMLIKNVARTFVSLRR